MAAKLDKKGLIIRIKQDASLLKLGRFYYIGLFFGWQKWGGKGEIIRKSVD
ncbi:hypothetical protein [Neobacillus sp. NPDC093127]|uniref:hypothetical protein n=1 Tax=Neobacillus sp. NPDC093127 TaxID=3364296 RepID=UPI00382DE184